MYEINFADDLLVFSQRLLYFLNVHVIFLAHCQLNEQLIL